MAGNSVTVGKSPKGIVSEAAYTALAPAVAQARNNLIDPMTVWEKLTTPRKKRRNSIITDSNLASSGANKDNKSGSRHIIGGKKNSKNERTRRRREAKTIK
jgi:hypothetical protein